MSTFEEEFLEELQGNIKGAVVDGSKKFFEELGQLQQKMRSGVVLAQADILNFASKAEGLYEAMRKANATVSAAWQGLENTLTPQDRYFRDFVKRTESEVAEISRILKAEVNTGNVTKRFASTAARFLGIVGSVLTVYDIAAADNGAERAGEVTGFFTGALGAWAAGAFAVALFGTPVGWIGLLGLGIVTGIGAVLGDTMGSLAGKAVWNELTESEKEAKLNELIANVEEIYGPDSPTTQQVKLALTDAVDKLGNLDGTWMQGFSELSAEQKADLTAALIGSTRGRTPDVLRADLRVLFEGEWGNDRLPLRDALIGMMSDISRNLSLAYDQPYIHADEGVLTLDVPVELIKRNDALSDLVQTVLSEHDAAHVGIFGVEKIKIALSGNTVTGTTKDDLIIGSPNAEALTGDAGSDYLIGSTGADSLTGGAGGDVLFGGADNDLLDGGAGSDYLYGGAGSDTYVFTGTWGSDTIFDTDGIVKIDGNQVNGGKKVAPGFWSDDNYNYSLVTNGGGGTDLVISKGSSLDTITVRNWQDGQLGITLKNADAPSSTTFDQTIALQSNNGEGSHHTSDPGKYFVTGTSYSDDIKTGADDDQIAGGGGFDHLDGGDGNDRIYANAVIDVEAAVQAADIAPAQPVTTAAVIEAGRGDDLVIGEASNYLYGGGGTDTLVGGGANDTVQGDTWLGMYTNANGSLKHHFDYDETRHKYHYYVSWTTSGGTSYFGHSGLIAEDGAADRIITGNGDDIALGEVGNDYVSLGAGNDVGVGGEDSDTLHGGGDNDTLFGDFGWDASAPPAGAPQQELAGYEGLPAEYHGNDVLDGGAGADYIEGNGRDDHLYGGDGADRLLGDDKITPGAYHGNDYLDGGADDDILEGGGKDDELFGGTGHDKLFGDDEHDILDCEFHGQDYLDGEDGNDTIEGGGKDDILFGGEDNDKLFGDAIEPGLAAAYHGKDYLDGENGDDQLVGGGNDDELFGGDGKDTLRGDGDDTVIGGAAHGADYLDGEGGDDALTGDGGNDILYGGEGNDTLQGDYVTLAGEFHGADYLDGEEGNDTLFGMGGDDTLAGGDGDDELHGDAATLAGEFHGADHLDGGKGNDMLFGFGGDDTLAGGDGNDQLQGDAGDDMLSGGNDDDLLLGNAGNDFLMGDAGNDELQGGDGGDHLEGGSGVDLLAGEAGGDLLFGGEGDDIVSGGEGQDLLDGGEGNDQMTAGEGDDQLLGGAGDDALFADGGNDTIDGGAGANYLDGGAGNDTYIIHEGTNDQRTIIADSGGDNRVVFDFALTSTTYNYTNYTEAVLDVRFLPVQGSHADAVLQFGKYGQHEVYLQNGLTHATISNFEFANGQILNRADIMALAPALTIVGGENDDDIMGGKKDDNLSGGDGADRLAGGGGADLLTGGLGNDTYVFNLGDGQDQIVNAADDHAVSVDTIELGAGIAVDDVVLNRTGNDLTVKVGTADALTVQNYFETGGAQKIDRIQFADGPVWDQAAIEERVVIAGATAGNDTISGFSTSDILQGLDGNDTIYGNGGNDQLSGDNGADSLIGGNGNDAFDGGQGADIMYGYGGSDTYLFQRGSGTDTVREYDAQPGDVDAIVMGADIKPEDIGVRRIYNQGSNPQPNDLLVYLKRADGVPGWDEYVLVKDFFARQDGYSRVEQIKFADGTIWDADVLGAMAASPITEAGDTILGYAWDDNLDGLGGDDFVDGLQGNDILAGGTGNDTLKGGDGSDILSGGVGIDQLDAGAGNDTLDGGVGRDTLKGGAGNDTYLFGLGSGSDRLNETSQTGGSVDTIKLNAGIAPAGVALYRHGDDLVLSLVGSQDQLWVGSFFSGSGDFKIEQIAFSDGTVWDLNTIQSKVIAGTANAMTGTAGNDTFIVDHVLDAVSEGSGQGIDTIQSSVTYTASQNVENLTLTGVLDTSGYGNELNNVIRGNSGNNVLYDGSGTDTLYGGSGDDYLNAASDNAVDILYGEDGNDILSDNNGYNLLYGGKGDDTYLLEFNSNPLTDPQRIVELAGEGIDTIKGRGGIIPDNVENMIVTTSAYSNRVVTGNVLDNVIAIESLDGYRLDGGAGADTLIGGQGDDTYIVDNVGDHVIESHSTWGKDVVQSCVSYTLGENLENLVLLGNAASNGTGNNLNNVLNGSAYVDPDTASGDTGNLAKNVLSGGTGDDLYFVDENDLVVEQAGEGNDTVKIASASTSAGSYSLSSYANIENLILTNIAGASNAAGSDGSNWLTGNVYDNVLSGGAGDDGIAGGDGNDTLDGGIGNDLLYGAYPSASSQPAGDDTYVFGRGDGQDVICDHDQLNGQDKIRFKAGISAADLILSRQSSDLAGFDDLVIDIQGSGERITIRYHFHVDSGTGVAEWAIERFEFADGTIWNMAAIQARLNDSSNSATAADNTIVGNDSADTIDALEGNDFVSGGLGNDVVSGGAGNDILFGNDGSDTLDGGVGNDELYGGEGSNVYRFGRGYEQDFIVQSETVNGQLNTILLASDVLPADVTVSRDGDDLVVKINDTSDQISVRGFFADAANEIQQVTFADGTQWSASVLRQLAETIAGTDDEDVLLGTADDNVIYGLGGNDIINAYEGNDFLDGGAGSDDMYGELGDDTYLVDNAADIVNEFDGEGIDTILSSVTLTLSANVENLTLTGTAAINGTGNSLANILLGNSANNTLDGGAGADTMSGGAGNDTYVLNSTSDVVTENAGEGADLVKSNVTYTLSTNVENLTLTGTSAINGTGNSLDNVITGNSAANTLNGGAGRDIINGGAGADKMYGGVGDDTYTVDNNSDVVTENAGEGVDLVNSRITHTLGANVENLTLTGTSAISGTGNGLDNVIIGNSAGNTLTGNAGNDTLNGGAGADKMRGGSGNDVYIVDNKSDTVTENSGAGTDLVQSSITYTLGTNVEALTLTGTNAINGTGNTSNNLLIGNAATNTLNGSGGTDLLQGAAGTDKLTDTSGNNLFDGGAGNDTVTGGTGRNFIIGGTGNDTIATNTGADVIAFNLGDGQDTVAASTGKDNTLSLGNGIRYADLLFKKNANDLILMAGTNDQITFKDWYVSTNNHSVANLQIVIEGTADYDASSANQLNNKKIEQFNFDGLVTKFDQARAANPSLTSWALSSSLLNFHLAGSDTAAIGGNLAYQYARNGNLSAFSMTPAQALLASTQFGVANQNLQATSALQDQSPRMI